MAKDKGKKGKEPVKAEKKEAAPEFKYGVSDVAEALGIENASVRVKLRKSGVEKAGKSYGWNSKADLQEVIDQLKAEDKEEKSEKKSSKKAEKPAKAPKGKKAKKDEDDD